MCLLNERESRFSPPSINPRIASIGPAPDWLRLDCFGDERPRDMVVLLAMLVLLLHVWLLQCLTRPVEPVSPAKRLVMEVGMIALSAQPATVSPQSAPSQPPKMEKKPLPKKTQPKKPIVKKAPPLIQPAPEFAPLEPMAETPSVSASPTTGSSALSVSHNQAEVTNGDPHFTEANYRANYAHNPKPNYPALARNRGWTGKVLLRVRVSAQGLSDVVAVEQSSGYDALDESAVDAVKQWRFIPAKRGETAVASSVIVPIVFSLRN
ncbi:TonB family protein [Methylomonas sp. MgM2]